MVKGTSLRSRLQGWKKLRAAWVNQAPPRFLRYAQDDGFVEGLEYNQLNTQKTRKIEKVTGSQDDDFVVG
jgi:hypothetical protein